MKFYLNLRSTNNEVQDVRYMDLAQILRGSVTSSSLIMGEIEHWPWEWSDKVFEMVKTQESAELNDLLFLLSTKPALELAAQAFKRLAEDDYCLNLRKVATVVHPGPSLESDSNIPESSEVRRLAHNHKIAKTLFMKYVQLLGSINLMHRSSTWQGTPDEICHRLRGRYTAIDRFLTSLLDLITSVHIKCDPLAETRLTCVRQLIMTLRHLQRAARVLTSRQARTFWDNADSLFQEFLQVIVALSTNLVDFYMVMLFDDSTIDVIYHLNAAETGSETLSLFWNLPTILYKSGNPYVLMGHWLMDGGSLKDYLSTAFDLDALDTRVLDVFDDEPKEGHFNV